MNKMLRLATVLSATLFGILFIPHVAASSTVHIKTLSTGIGANERFDRTGYSTVMFFSERGSGSMVADVKVVILKKEATAEQKILETTSADPLFFVNLPTGSYYVEALYQGHKQGAVFTVDGKCQKVVGLSWPAETKGLASSSAPLHEHHARTRLGGPCSVTQETRG